MLAAGSALALKTDSQARSIPGPVNWKSLAALKQRSYGNCHCKAGLGDHGSYLPVKRMQAVERFRGTEVREPRNWA